MTGNIWKGRYCNDEEKSVKKVKNSSLCIHANLSEITFILIPDGMER
jgi:hypothetical protein